MEDRTTKLSKRREKRKEKNFKELQGKIYMEDRWDIQLCIQKMEQSQAHKKYSKCNSRKLF